MLLVRALLFALGLALAAPALSACTTAQVQAVTPESPRQTLAVAETAFVGVATVAGALYDVGAINQAQAQVILAKLEDVSRALDQARLLLKIGENPAALALLVTINSDLDGLSVELLTAREAAQRSPT